jgi:hypothetical protein
MHLARSCVVGGGFPHQKWMDVVVVLYSSPRGRNAATALENWGRHPIQEGSPSRSSDLFVRLLKLALIRLDDIKWEIGESACGARPTEAHCFLLWLEICPPTSRYSLCSPFSRHVYSQVSIFSGT